MAMSSVRQLRNRMVRPDDESFRPESVDPTRDDPLGIDVQGRGMEHARQQRADLIRRSYDEANPLLQIGTYGPLPDPKWEGFFQSLEDQGVTGIVGGPSAPGSNQIRGQSVSRPSFGTAGDALAGVADSMSGQPGSMQALSKATRQRQAAAAAKAAAAEAAQQTVTAAPTPPKAPPPPPDPALARTRLQAGMLPGSLDALRQRMMGGA